jgi:hypothetical protein
MDRITNPPAAVQCVESRSAIVRNIGALIREFDQCERLNLERALQIGRELLRLKEMCKVGEYTRILQELGIPSQRASEFTRGAQRPASVQATWQSLNDLRQAIALESAPSASGTPTRGGTGPSVSSMDSGDDGEDGSEGGESSRNSPTIAGMAPPPEEPEVLCEDCQRKGARRDCPRCEELALVQPSTPPPPRAPRAPRQASQQGKPAFSIMIVDKPLGELIRGIDQARTHYGDCKYFQTIDKLLMALGREWKLWLDEKAR